jgi:serine/threonine protein kinase
MRSIGRKLHLSTPEEVALTEVTAERKLTAEGVLVGTLQYMAPEQLEGKDADARTDIFALGEIAYDMTTGRPPFNGKSKASLIAAILSSEPPEIATLKPLVPATLSRAVKTCLLKDPADRFQTAHDLKLGVAMDHGCRLASVVAGSCTGSEKTFRTNGVDAGCAIAFLGRVRDHFFFVFQK